MKIIDQKGLTQVKEKGLKKIAPAKTKIAVGFGTCGIGNGADLVFEAFKTAVKEKKLDILVEKTGCFGFCAKEPLVNIQIPGKSLVILDQVTEKDVEKIVMEASEGKVSAKKALCRIEEWDFHTSQIDFGKGFDEIPVWNDISFFKWQKKIVLRDCGIINPEDIEEYIGAGGYQPLFNVLTKSEPTTVLEEVKKSKLRGRGGAGFPTGVKWELMRKEPGETKYVVCNADEGDPGAFMNRNEIESDPHMLIEGMMIAAYAMGAKNGIVYIRAEYPLAVERFKKAIDQAKEYGILGEKVFGTNFCFDLEIVEGAGAFVCGEETSLIASIEGKAGRPRPRPPFPAQRGVWGNPTNINNVETYCNVPAILAKGGEWFAKTGTEKSSGTKVFSLVGKVKNTGLVELPLGSPLETIVFQIGEGAPNGKRVKAVQTARTVGRMYSGRTLRNGGGLRVAYGSWRDNGFGRVWW